jgi:hypothetical protein
VMLVLQKNARPCEARATFSLRWAQQIQTITSARSKSMINSPPIRTSQFTGAIRRSLRRDYVWRRKASAPMRLPRFTKYWRKTRIQIGGANSSGITRRGLTPRACWRKIRSGNLPLLSMKNSLQREAAEAKKLRPVLPIFGWSISFGQINHKGLMAENLGLLS